MHIVHLKKTMPPLVADIRRGIPDDVALDQIREITRGDWALISNDALRLYSDYVVGAYEGTVVSVYRIESYAWTGAVPTDRVAFEVVRAPEMAWMIGQPVVGGPWKQGESRPVRYAFRDEVEEFYAETVGLTEADKAKVPTDPETFDERILDGLREIAQGVKRERPRKATATGSGTVLDDVEIEVNPRGGIIVTVPAGTRVLIVPRAA